MRTGTQNKGSGPRDVRLVQASLEEIAGELHRRARLAGDRTGQRPVLRLDETVEVVRTLGGSRVQAGDVRV